MVDKSKMTVAEMLAAARKADNKGGAPAESAPAESASTASDGETSEAAPAPPAAAASTSPTTAAAKKPSGGGKPSVADILAMARAKKDETAAAAPAAAAPKPAAKPAAAKAAPAKKEAAAAPAGPVDTQSILTAARKAAQPGPMTKAEAAAKGVALAPPPKKPPKESIVVPPMPVKPDYAKKPADRTSAEIAERRAFLFGMSALAVGFTAMARVARTLDAWHGAIHVSQRAASAAEQVQGRLSRTRLRRGRWRSSSKPNSASGS